MKPDMYTIFILFSIQFMENSLRERFFTQIIPAIKRYTQHKLCYS